MTTAGDIRAGGAFVELNMRSDGFKQGMAEVGSIIRGVGSVMAGIGAGMAAVGAAIAAPVVIAQRALFQVANDVGAKRVEAVFDLSFTNRKSEFESLRGDLDTLGVVASKSLVATSQRASDAAKLGREGFRVLAAEVGSFLAPSMIETGKLMVASARFVQQLLKDNEKLAATVTMVMKVLTPLSFAFIVLGTAIFLTGTAITQLTAIFGALPVAVMLGAILSLSLAVSGLGKDILNRLGPAGRFIADTIDEVQKAIASGNSVIDVFRDRLNVVVDAVQQFIAKHGKAIQTTLMWAGAIAAAAAGMFTLTRLLGPIVKGIESLRIVLTSVLGVIRVLGNIILVPFVVLANVGVLLARSLTFVITIVQILVTILNAGARTIALTFQVIFIKLFLLKTALFGIVGAFKVMWTVGKAVLTGLTTLWTFLNVGVATTFNLMGITMTASMVAITSGLLLAITGLLIAITLIVTGWGSAILAFFSDLFSAVARFGKLIHIAIFGSLTELFAHLVETELTGALKVMQRIGAAMIDLWNRFSGQIAAAFRAGFATFSDRFEEVKAESAATAAAMSADAKGTAGKIKDSSILAMGSLGAVSEGFSAAIDKVFGSILRFLQAGQFEAAFESLKANGLALWFDMTAGIQEAWIEMWPTLLDSIGNFVANLGPAVETIINAFKDLGKVVEGIVAGFEFVSGATRAIRLTESEAAVEGRDQSIAEFKKLMAAKIELAEALESEKEADIKAARDKVSSLVLWVSEREQVVASAERLAKRAERVGKTVKEVVAELDASRGSRAQVPTKTEAMFNNIADGIKKAADTARGSTGKNIDDLKKRSEEAKAKAAELLEKASELPAFDAGALFGVKGFLEDILGLGDEFDDIFNRSLDKIGASRDFKDLSDAISAQGTFSAFEAGIVAAGRDPVLIEAVKHRKVSEKIARGVDKFSKPKFGS